MAAPPEPRPPQPRPVAAPARPGGRAVLADVARAAGVSQQTVSRVVNGHPSVSPATRARVQGAVDALGYRPDPTARALATRRTHRVGVVTTGAGLHGPSAVLRGVEQAARRAGYGVSVAVVAESGGDPAGEVADAYEALRGQHVDGLVVLAPQDALASSLVVVDPHLPLVHASPPDLTGPCRPRGSDGSDGDADEDALASSEQGAAAAAAVEHLLALGHRTVHHVTGPLDWRESRARRAGWAAALRAAGREVPAPAVGRWDAASGASGTAALLAAAGRGAPAVTALLVANDQMALGALRALHDAGLRVPQDVSVVGFDDVPEAAYYHPPLTTVRVDFEGQGRRCLAELLGALGVGAGPDGAPVQPPALVVRASTGPAPSPEPAG